MLDVDGDVYARVQGDVVCCGDGDSDVFASRLMSCDPGQVEVDDAELTGRVVEGSVTLPGDLQRAWRALGKQTDICGDNRVLCKGSIGDGDVSGGVDGKPLADGGPTDGVV